MSQDLAGLDVTLSSILGGIFAAGMIIAIGVFLLFSLIVLFFHTFTLMFGAKVVDIKDRTFGKALMATFLSLFIGSIPCAILFFIAWPLGVVAFLVMPCFVIKWIYDCSLGQAFLASISSLVASFIVVIALIIGIVFFIKGAIDQKKSTDTEKVSKVEIKEIPEPSIFKSNDIEKITMNPPIKKSGISKAPFKEPVKIKATPKKEIAKKSSPEKAINKTPDKVPAKVSNSNKSKKISTKVAAKPKAKTKSADKKPLPPKRTKST